MALPASAGVKEMIAVGLPALAVKVVGVSAGLVASAIIGRTIGPQGLGALMLAITLVHLVAIPARLGLDQLAMRLVSTSLDRGDHAEAQAVVSTTFAATLATGAMATLAILSFSDTLSQHIFAEPTLHVPLVVLSSAVIPWGTGVVLNHCIRATGHPVIAAFLNEASSSLVRAALLAFFLVRTGQFEIRDAAWVYAVSLWLSFITNIVVLRWDGIRLPGRTSFEQIRQLSRKGLPFVGIAVTLYLISITDVLMLGILSDTVEVGKYTVAARVASVIGFLVAMANMFIAPRVAVLYGRRALVSLEEFTRSTSGALALSALALAAPVLSYSSPILGLWGDEFTSGVPCLQLLVISNFVTVATGAVATVLSMAGHEKKVLVISAISAMVNVALNWALISRLGATGAALATAIAVVISNLGYVVAVRRVLGISPVFFLPRRLSGRQRP